MQGWDLVQAERNFYLSDCIKNRFHCDKNIKQKGIVSIIGNAIIYIIYGYSFIWHIENAMLLSFQAYSIWTWGQKLGRLFCQQMLPLILSAAKTDWLPVRMKSWTMFPTFNQAANTTYKSPMSLSQIKDLMNVLHFNSYDM